MKKFISLLLILTSILSCKKDDDLKIVQERNQWIYDHMHAYYLWANQIPNDIPDKTSMNSFDYFDKFIYKDEDQWSYISDDYFETSDMYNNITTSAGFSFYLYYIGDDQIIGAVQYVSPNSPASDEGMKRGDIITKVNNTSINSDNYYQLFSQGGSYSLQLAHIEDSTIIEDGIAEITEVANFYENPISLDTVYSIGGQSIGYMVYNNFVFNQLDTTRKDSLDIVETFKAFKSQNITDLVIDLRYNSGGNVLAEYLLANLIAPTSADGYVFAKTEYNSSYAAYRASLYGEEHAIRRIYTHAESLDLSGKLIALTSSLTASASEALLNGLSPLMDVTLIGDTTHGKHTSLMLIPDDYYSPQWVIIPVVAISTNADEVSVKGGMIPDYLLDDNPLDGYPLGDINETMLSRALQEATGTTQPSTRSASSRTKLPLSKITSFKNGKKQQAIPQIIDTPADILND